MSSPIDRQHPWPGLAAYGEDESAYFFGRTAETAELLRQVEDVPLVVLHGRSGLGKTSLLNAGLFPKLRVKNYFPVWLRLNHDPPEGSPEPVANYARQVIQLVETAAVKAGVDGPKSSSPAATLWEYFHLRRTVFWSDSHRVLTPVLVFDQFEEFFQKGSETDQRLQNAGRFYQQLSDLVFNSPPASFRDALDRGAVRLEDYDPDRVPIRVLVSLREDFLAQLTDLAEPGFPDPNKPCFPNLLKAHVHMQPLSPDKARECIDGPAPELLEPGVTDKLLPLLVSSRPPRFVEPALLNIACRELNTIRIKRELRQIQADLFKLSLVQILSDFYEDSWKDVQPEFRHYVETTLITPAGFRDSRALEDVCSQPDLDTEAKRLRRRADIEALVTHRLLQYREDPDGTRIELIHDLLCPLAAASRSRWQEEEKARAAAEAEEEKRRIQAALEEEKARRLEAERLRRRSRRLAIAAGTVAVFAIGALCLAIVDTLRMRAAKNDTTNLVRFQASLGYRLSPTVYQESSAAAAYTQIDMMQNIVNFGRAYFKDHPPLPNDPTAISIEADVYEQLGSVLEWSGDAAGALGAYVQSLKDRKLLVAKDAHNAEWQRGLARDFEHVGDVLKLTKADDQTAKALSELLGSTSDADKLAQALPAYRKAYDTFGFLAHDNPSDGNLQNQLALSYDLIGSLFAARSQFDVALRYYERALKIRKDLNGAKNSEAANPDWQYALARSYGNFGSVYSNQARLGDAINQYQQAIAILRRLYLSVNGNNGLWAFDLAGDLGAVGGIYEKEGNLRYASAQEKDKEGDLKNANAQENTNTARSDLALLDPNNSDYRNANDQYAFAQAVRLSLVSLDPNRPDWQGKLAIGYDHLGDIANGTGDLQEAHKQYTYASNIRNTLAKTNKSDQVQIDLATSLTNLGVVDQEQGSLDDALKKYQGALKIRQDLAGRDPANAGKQSQLAAAYDHVGDICRLRDDFTNALENYQNSLRIRTDLVAAADQDHKAVTHTPQLLVDLATSFDNIGATLVDEGEQRISRTEYGGAKTAFAEAQTDFEQAKANLAKVIKTIDSVVDDPGKKPAYPAQWLNEVALNCDGFGSIAKNQSDPGMMDAAQAEAGLKQAEGYFQQCINIESLLTGRENENVQWKHEFALNLDHMGEVLEQRAGRLKDQGKDSSEAYAQALANYQKSRDLLTHLDHVAQKRNAEWTHDLALNSDHLGDVAGHTGDYLNAFNYHLDCMIIEEGLVKAQGESVNEQWRRDLEEGFDHVVGILDALHRDTKNPADYVKSVQVFRPVVGELRQLSPANSPVQDKIKSFEQQTAEVPARLPAGN